ncbi:transcriptional regulator protein [Rhizobium rhizogenes K84]|uniref:Transcriptional regulator protein n=2 Tax=Rhizobium rhizogenes TaxID=359 RepID=B9JB48_RHIR8|nr:transcriptional regulator protein [Rhizobium rhizogenes K84]
MLLMHDRVLKTLTANSQRQSVRGRGAAPDTQSTHLIDRHVGQQLRIIRMHSNLSQTELGQLVGLRHQQIEQFESSKNRMNTAVLCEVANCLNVPIARVFEALPLTELASSDGSLPEIGECIADLPTSESCRYVKEILRLPPQLRTRALALIKFPPGDDGDIDRRSRSGRHLPAAGNHGQSIVQERFRRFAVGLSGKVPNA